MQDLLSYQLSDLLLFSEQGFLRQFELYSAWLGPMRWLYYLYGLLSFFAMLVSRPALIRFLFLTLVLLWLISSYGYLWLYYAAINWLAGYFIAVFMLQSCLIVIGLFRSRHLPARNPCGKTLISAALLCLHALAGQPLIEYASKVNAFPLSMYAATPDALACMTIAFMLALRVPVLFFIPAALWLLFSALTYLALGSLMAVYPLSVLAVYLYMLLSTFIGRSAADH